MFYSYRGNWQKEISGIVALSYTIDVLGGVTYQFHVRAVTIKPGPNASSTVHIPEFSEFSFHFIIKAQVDRFLVCTATIHLVS